MFLKSYFDLFEGTSPQLLCMLLCTLNAISDGMHFAWSAPTVPILLSENSAIKITENDVVWLEILYMIFGFLALPITMYLANKIGRQKSVLVASSTSLIGWILIGIGDRVEYLFVARSLIGAAGDVAFVCSPMYVAEIAHQKIRGFLAGFIYVMQNFGSLLIYCIAPFVSVRIPPIIGGCILLTQLSIFPFMPESPHFHLYKGNEKAARKSLKFLRGTDEIDEELKEITITIEKQKAESGRWLDLFLIKSNRKAMMIMTFLNAAQHMIGYTAILMNLHTILNAAGDAIISSNVAAILYAAVMFFASIIAILTLDKFGRKRLINLSTLFTGICLLIIAIFFHLQYLSEDVSQLTLIPFIFIMAFAASFKLGIGMVPIVLTSELFSSKVKAKGMTYADGCFVVFAGISIYIYQFLNMSFGLFSSFYLFSAFSFLTFFLSLVYVPETKGKTLGEIQIMLQN